MACLNSLLDRIYNRETYNCAHFVSDVWLIETGINILPMLTPLMPIINPKVPKKLARVFTRVSSPINYNVPILVLMKQSKSENHIGVYIRNKVWQLQAYGAIVLSLDIATIGFLSVKYYRYKNA